MAISRSDVQVLLENTNKAKVLTSSNYSEIIPLASSSKNGLMSISDKIELDRLRALEINNKNFLNLYTRENRSNLNFLQIRDLLRKGLGSRVYKVNDTLRCNHLLFGILTWKISKVEDDHLDLILSEPLDLGSSPCFDSGYIAYDPQEEVNGDIYFIEEVCSIWSKSDLRDWANSSKIGNLYALLENPGWLERTNKYNYTPNSYPPQNCLAKTDGFLNGLDPNFRTSLIKTYVLSYPSRQHKLLMAKKPFKQNSSYEPETIQGHLEVYADLGIGGENPIRWIRVDDPLFKDCYDHGCLKILTTMGWLSVNTFYVWGIPDNEFRLSIDFSSVSDRGGTYFVVDPSELEELEDTSLWSSYDYMYIPLSSEVDNSQKVFIRDPSIGENEEKDIVPVSGSGSYTKISLCCRIG